MRGIDRHRSQKRVEFFLAIFVDKTPGLGVQFVQCQNTNTIFRQSRTQRVPAIVLFVHELVRKARQNVALVGQG